MVGDCFYFLSPPTSQWYKNNADEKRSCNNFFFRQHQGISEGNVRCMLSNWKKRGYIEEYGGLMPQNEVARQQYIKTESYLEKHPQAA